VNEVWVIRSAPTIDELENIEPTDLVVLYEGYGNKDLPDERRADLAKRIKEAVHWAKNNGVKVKEYDYQSQTQEVQRTLG
jgi:hypothetical protein